MANTYTLITSQSIPAAHSFTINSIPQTYTDLLIKFSMRSNYGSVSHEGQFRMNGLTTGYVGRLNYGTSNNSSAQTATPGSTDIATWSLLMNGTSSTANTFSNGEIYITNYSNSSYSKTWSCNSVAENNSTGPNQFLVYGNNTSTSPITSLTFYAWQSFINFDANSTIYVYGISNS